MWLDDREYDVFQRVGGSAFLRGVLRYCKANEEEISRLRYETAMHAAADAEAAMRAAEQHKALDREAVWVGLDEVFAWRTLRNPERQLGGWLEGATGRKFLARHAVLPEEVIEIFREKVGSLRVDTRKGRRR